MAAGCKHRANERSGTGWHATSLADQQALVGWTPAPRADLPGRLLTVF
jgi:hypothetical protein